MSRGRLFHYFLIACVCFLANAVVVLNWPRTGGDWDSYGTVAENIYRGHGVSLSIAPPFQPDFGGNSFPGYPAFIAGVWSLSGKSDAAVRWAQAFLFALSIGLFGICLERAFAGRAIGLVFAWLAALSPLTMAWSRSLQVEALSMAGLLFYFSALLISFHEGRIRVLPISLAILFSLSLRTDAILLIVPLFSLFLVERETKKARCVKTGSVIAIVCIVMSIWFVRNLVVHARHVLPPSMLILHEGDVYPAPKGYLLWGWTWMSKEYERGGWGFPVTRAAYDSIYIPDSAYDEPEEKQEVERLLTELATYKGMAFPAHIDQRFREIALERLGKHPFRILVGLPLKRMFHLWFHPGGSAGWPIEFQDLSYQLRVELEKSYLSAAWMLLKTHPVKVIGKGVVFSFTMLEYVCGALGLFLLFRGGAKGFFYAVLSYLVVRTVFYAMTNNVENRYMAQVIPLLHFLTAYTAVVCYEGFRHLSKRRPAMV